MQFLVTQIHDPENCPKDIGGLNPFRMAETKGYKLECYI